LAPPRRPAILAARPQEAAAIRPLSFLLAAAFAALAAAPPLAAKPPAVGVPDAGDAYRERGIALCVADLRIVADLSGEDREAICGCALGRFMDRRRESALPPLGPGRFRGVMESELLACTSELRPDRAGEVAARGAAPPDAVVYGKPPAPAGPAADAPRRERGDPGAWLRARIAALPAAAWVAIGFLFLLLLGALIRRRDDRRDLLGPPPSMRRVDSPRPKPFRLEL
jgi:hypothetical protein